jgi:glycosyltransferase involved in cell wall biosynthesis
LAIASAVREIISNPQLADEMSREARRLSATLSWESVARQYLAMTNVLIQRLDVPA